MHYNAYHNSDSPEHEDMVILEIEDYVFMLTPKQAQIISCNLLSAAGQASASIVRKVMNKYDLPYK
jgi:hypothetical protein